MAVVEHATYAPADNTSPQASITLVHTNSSVIKNFAQDFCMPVWLHQAVKVLVMLQCSAVTHKILLSDALHVSLLYLSRLSFFLAMEGKEKN